MLSHAHILAFLHGHVVGHHVECLCCRPPKLLEDAPDNSQRCRRRGCHTHGWGPEHGSQVLDEVRSFGSFHAHYDGFVPWADFKIVLQVAQPLIEGFNLLCSRFFPRQAWLEFWGCSSSPQLTCRCGKIGGRVPRTKPLLLAAMHAAERSFKRATVATLYKGGVKSRDC